MMLDALAGKGAVRIDKSQSVIEQLTHRVQVDHRYVLFLAPRRTASGLSGKLW